MLITMEGGAGPGATWSDPVMLQPTPACSSGRPCPDCSFSHFLGSMPILASSQNPKSVDLSHEPNTEFVVTLSL